MANTALLADLDRALELLKQVDETLLDFTPDAGVSEDIRNITGIENYPTGSHVQNVQARFDAVVSAGDKLKERGASDYVSKIIPACVKLGPSIDDWRASKRVSAVHGLA